MYGNYGRCVVKAAAMRSSICGWARAQDGQQYRDYIAKLSKNLKQNIVDFWDPPCIDRENGGYRIDFDAEGKPAGTNDKMIVTQARMVWLFSRLARKGYDPGKETGGGRMRRSLVDTGSRSAKTGAILGRREQLYGAGATGHQC